MRMVSLDTFCGGGFAEQVNRCLREIAENIQDPNTPAEKTRTLTCKVTFKPDSTRRLIAATVTSGTTLAPAAGITSTFVAGKDLATGRVEMAEYNDGIPGQMAMDAAGEVYDAEEKALRDKVIDLRKQA